MAPTAIVYAVNNGFTQSEEYYTAPSTLAFGARSAVTGETDTTVVRTEYESMTLSTLTFASPNGVPPEKLVKRSASE